jgi:hypothetical protein
MSGMPPSPASDKMLTKVVVTNDKEGNPLIKGMVTHQPSEIGRRLMKELPDSQIGWRSRAETTMSNLTQLNEFKKRLKAMKDPELIQALKPYAMPSDISERLYSHKIKTLIKHLKIDHDYIRKYVNEHKTSSVSPGLKWADLPDPSEDAAFWKMYFEHMKDIAEQLLVGNRLPAFPMNLGGRARPETVTHRDTWTYDVHTTRSRIVMFHPALSTFFVFVPNKTAFYKEVWDYSKDVMGLSDLPILFPPVDGGLVYKAWGEGLKDKVDLLVVILGDDWNMIINGEQFSWDGSNWEQFVPLILGEAFYPCFTSFGGHVALPSGVWSTTIDGTIAMAWLASRVLDSKQKEVPGVFEIEQEDVDRNFMLGLRYVDDPMYPRLQGLKLTVDDATKTRRLKNNVAEEFESKYKEAESISWYNAYHGLTLSGESLLSPFSEIEAEDWVNPSKIAQKVIFDVQD